MFFNCLTAQVPLGTLRTRRVSFVAIAFTAVAASVAIFVSSATADGVVATFQPQPVSSTLTDVIWSQNQLRQGPGAVGTNFSFGAGDGEPSPCLAADAAGAFH